MAVKGFANNITGIAFLLPMLFVLCLQAHGQSRRVQPTPTPTPEDDTVRIITEEIKVNVLAFDEEGKFVGDVKTGDLVVTDNNVLHQASSVRRIPANVLIVLDTGGEMRSVKTLKQTRDTARSVVAGLRDGDFVAVMQYADKVEFVTEWTDDKSRALEGIDRTKFGRRSVFAAALKQASDFLMKNRLENKHLVLITDGTDSTVKWHETDRAMRNLLATDVNVHVISYTKMEAADIEPRTKMISKTPPPKALPDEIAAQLPNGARDIATAPKVGPTINLDRTLLKKLRARKAELEVSEEALSDLAENTNGTIIIPETTDEMVAKAETVAKFIDSSYVLTYTPKIPVSERSGPRNIEVTSKRPGLVVQSKRRLIVAQQQ